MARGGGAGGRHQPDDDIERAILESMKNHGGAIENEDDILARILEESRMTAAAAQKRR